MAQGLLGGGRRVRAGGFALEGERMERRTDRPECRALPCRNVTGGVDKKPCMRYGTPSHYFPAGADMEVFLKGMAVGLAYLAPIGFQNLFVIHSAIFHPRRRAMLIAAIVIFFDVTLALASFLGAGALLEAWPGIRKAVLLIGGHVLMLMGFKLIKAKVAERGEGSSARSSLWKSAVAAFAVSWMNPQAIIDATLLLGAARASVPAGQDWLFMGGMASASCLWFTCLTLGVSLLGDHFSPRVLRIVNIVCGVALFLYGASLCFTAAGEMF